MGLFGFLKFNLMKNPLIVKHAKGAPGLRLFGIGGNFKPNKGIRKLSKLLNDNTYWATKRTKKDLKKMLGKSQVIISIWDSNQMIGFGRATSDEMYRAVLWDVVVDKKYQNRGLGKKIVKAILQDPLISKVEKIYLMTTNCQGFYFNMGFSKVEKQNLMMLHNKK